MTKAASYLLSFDAFSTMRKYLIDHVEWMVSDATGVAPKWGKPAGFEYETYGAFERAAHPGRQRHREGLAHRVRARSRSASSAFRFGYYDKKLREPPDHHEAKHDQRSTRGGHARAK